VARIEQARAQFGEMLDADLNTAGALGIVFDLVRALNAAIDAGEVGEPDVASIRGVFNDIDRVLGFISLRREEDARAAPAPAEIERLIGERQAARRRRDFAAADGIRKELAVRGIILEDSATGTRWKIGARPV